MGQQRPEISSDGEGDTMWKPSNTNDTSNRYQKLQFNGITYTTGIRSWPVGGKY